MLTVLTFRGAETLTGNAMLLAEHGVCWSIEVWDRSAIKVHTKGRKEIHSPQLSWPRAPRSQEEKVRHLDTKYFGGILYTDRLSKYRNSSPYPTQFWV